MNKYLIIALCLFISFQAFGQSRPGTGPGPGDLPAKELAKLITSNVTSNSKDCKTTQPFKNIVDIQNYISLKNVAANGKKDCSDMKPKVETEVKCLFKNFPAQYLTTLMSYGEPEVSEHLMSDLGLDDKEAKVVWEFYKKLDITLINE